jgi:hypothetical protein
MTEPITFLACLPDVLSQMKIGKDGMRLQLEIPETELPEALKLVLWRDVVLKVTVEPEGQAGAGNGRTDKDKLAEGAKRKPRWRTTEKQSIDGAPGESG